MAHKRIYISLDELMDTRLGTIAKLSEVAAERIMQNPLYWAREQDDWGLLTGGLVSNAEFAKAYDARDNSTLRHSMLSSIQPVLIKLYAEHALLVKDGLTEDEFILNVNIHPYELETEELETLTECLRYYLGEDTPVCFNSHTPEELTPEVLTKKFDMAFFYNFQSWLKLHLEALLKLETPDFHIIVPRLYEKDTRGLTLEQKQEKNTIFHLFWLEHVNFQFIDVAYYSVFKP